MTTPVPARIPATLCELLDGEHLAHGEGKAFILATADGQGSLHQALISVGELLVPAPGELRIALHEASGTSANLCCTGRATLLAVLEQEEAAVTIHLSARPRGRVTTDGLDLVLFLAEVQLVRVHRTPYACVTSGPSFALTDASVRARWRRQIDQLRSLTPRV